MCKSICDGRNRQLSVLLGESTSKRHSAGLRLNTLSLNNSDDRRKGYIEKFGHYQTKIPIWEMVTVTGTN